MKIGIQYRSNLLPKELKDNGFLSVELPYGEDLSDPDIKTVGVIVKLDESNGTDFANALALAHKKNAVYLVVDTRGQKTTDKLYAIVQQMRDTFADARVIVCIENSYVFDANGHIGYSDYSEYGMLCEIVQSCNQIVGRERFGICLNMGYCNLLGQNIRKMITGTAAHLKVFHMNDNDGKHDMHQIPYTFTTGRGSLATDVYRAVGALMAMHFEGFVIFDTGGAFQRIPQTLQGAYLNLLHGIWQVWEEESHFEEKLCQPGKSILLFGAGAMAGTYLENWGEKYPPVCLIDNNPKLWGTKRYGYDIKPPAYMTEIPQEERLILICNVYYDEVAKQLQEMHIPFDYFWDQYYI